MQTNAERIQVMFSRISRGADPAMRSWRAVQSQPGWITKAAVLAFVLVIGVPLAMLVLLAMLAAVAVFAVLACIYTIALRIRRFFPTNDGRSSNIRVIERKM